MAWPGGKLCMCRCWRRRHCRPALCTLPPVVCGFLHVHSGSVVSPLASLSLSPLLVKAAPDEGAFPFAASPVDVPKVYPWRWVVLAVFCACTFTNASLWICFAPIQPQASDFFDVNASAVNMLSMVFMLLYFPGSVISSYCMCVRAGGGRRRGGDWFDFPQHAECARL